MNKNNVSQLGCKLMIKDNQNHSFQSKSGSENIQ